MSKAETECEWTGGCLPDEQGVKADQDRPFTLEMVEGATYPALREHTPFCALSQADLGKSKETKPVRSRICKYAGIAPPSQEDSLSPECFSGKYQRNPHQFHQPEAAFKPAGQKLAELLMAFPVVEFFASLINSQRGKKIRFSCKRFF